MELYLNLFWFDPVPLIMTHKSVTHIIWLFQEKETNEDWNACFGENSLEMGRCVYACNGDRNCEANCNDDFRQRQLECPCEVNILTSMLATVVGDEMC